MTGFCCFLKSCRPRFRAGIPQNTVRDAYIKRALELRVTCVIVCQAEVSRELLELDTDTCIISTPYDAYRAVHLICHSLPIERICKSHDLVPTTCSFSSRMG